MAIQWNLILTGFIYKNGQSFENLTYKYGGKNTSSIYVLEYNLTTSTKYGIIPISQLNEMTSAVE